MRVLQTYDEQVVISILSLDAEAILKELIDPKHITLGNKILINISYINNRGNLPKAQNKSNNDFLISGSSGGYL